MRGERLIGGVSKVEKADYWGSKIVFGGMSSTSQNVTSPISRVTGPIFFVEEMKGVILVGN